MRAKLIRGRRWIRVGINLLLWVLFIVFAFGYFLGGLIAARLPQEQAILVYRLALKIYPWSVANRNDLGLTLLSSGDVTGAIVELRATVQAAPYVAKYHNGLGAALLQNGDIDEAIQEFKEAIRLLPGYDDPRSNLERAISAKEKKR